jgi:hypothetical protein
MAEAGTTTTSDSDTASRRDMVMPSERMRLV